MAGSKVHLKLLRGTHPAVSGVVQTGPRHAPFKLRDSVRTAAVKALPVQTNALLAIKGEAAPAIGYDRHDPHFPFGRPVFVAVPRPPDGTENTASLKKYDNLVLPETAARIVEDLLAELVRHEGRPEPGPVHPVPENLLPLVLALFGRRIAVGNVQATSATIVDAEDGSGKTAHVTLQFSIHLPKTQHEYSEADPADKTIQSMQAMVIDELRAGRITFGEFKRIMGLKDREAVISFLAAHHIAPDGLVDNF
ncbi:MAG: hypothetical protein WCF85_02995 [Rhodospirillaceae bacterium]